MRATRLLVSVVGWFAMVSVAGAQAVYTHPVQEGDTLASIAERYYGDPTRESVLREANRLRGNGSDALLPGSWVFIPTVAFYQVRQDDTWKSIATKLYGSEDRASTLVDANDASRRAEPDEGAELLVPYPLRHVVAPGETLAKIANLYIEDDTQALKRLRRFNPGARIERGRVVLVPLFDLRLTGDGRSEASEAFAQLIAQVQTGQFEEAVSLANRMLGMQRLTSSQIVTIQKELAVAYVALERADLAEASFRTALSLQPNLELDSVRTSPLVLEVFNRARQTVTPGR